MTIQEFAAARRFKTSVDNCNETIIPGKHGLLYESSEADMGTMLITPASKPARTRFWIKLRGACQAAGMTLRQNGDAEGSFSFDPKNDQQVKLAMKLAGVRHKRPTFPPTEKQLAARASFLGKWKGFRGPQTVGLPG